MQCLLHRRVTELEPLLHEVDAQHGLHRKRLLASQSSLGRVATVFARRHPLVNTGPQNRLPTVQVH